MKTALKTIGLSLLILASISGLAQKNSCGLFFNANDYTNHHLSKQADNIAIDLLFHRDEIMIKHDGVKDKYSKDSVYAVEYNGSIIRLYNKSEYPLVNPNEKIMVYKVIAGCGSKGVSAGKPEYYFSKDANSKIEKLTIANIKAAFPDNRKFKELVEMIFTSDEDLGEYDASHKMTKINLALQYSLEKTSF